MPPIGSPAPRVILGDDQDPHVHDRCISEGRDAASRDRPAVGRAEQAAVLLGIVDREPAIRGMCAQRRERCAQVAEPVRWQIRGRPQEPLPGGDLIGDQGEDLRADRDHLRRICAPLDPVQQRRLADSLDRCGFCGRSTFKSLPPSAARLRRESGRPAPCCPASRSWPPGMASPAPPSTGHCPSCVPKGWSGPNEDGVPP